MQKFAWWAKLLFILLNAAIASYFANPFTSLVMCFAWLLSLGVSVLITGIVVSGLLMLTGMLLRVVVFFVDRPKDQE